MKIKMEIKLVEELLTVKVVHLAPVDTENAPCGGIAWNLTNQETFADYQVGQQYDVDISLVP